MKLSENLKNIRKENNLSQEQLAEKLGVSRQAVSKWESGQSYPEMDKVLLICKIFNYNIDELMNENIKEVEENKQSKININKYIDDFFGFITKTVDMFSSMKFRQKIKCLIEQFCIGVCLFAIFILIGVIASSVMSGIFGRLPANIYYIIRDIFESVYTLLALIIGTIIILHIFKIRYLDYYEIIKEDNEEKKDKQNEIEKIETNNEKKKIFIEKKKEKIIIRDPNHSQSKFLSGIFKFVLSCIKIIVVCIGILFVFSFIGLFTLLILSFLIAKTGLLFFGSLLCILSAIVVNFIILELIYNFIISKKSKKSRMAISFIISLVSAGIGIGMILIGITQFNYIKSSTNDNKIKDVYEFKMSEDLTIDYWNGSIEYVEEDTDKLKLVIERDNYLISSVEKINNRIEVYCFDDGTKTMELIKEIINNINNKEIKEYDYPKLYVYTSKKNIKKLKNNNEIKLKSNNDNNYDLVIVNAE